MRKKFLGFMALWILLTLGLVALPNEASALPTPSPVVTGIPTRVGYLTPAQAPISQAPTGTSVTALTVLPAGDQTITVDNTIFANKNVTGKILIKANNVLVFNNYVHTTAHTGNGIEVFNGYGNAMIMNNTVEGFENSVAGGNYTAYRLDVKGMEGDGFKLGDHTSVIGSYCHGVYVGPNGAHADCAQAEGSGVGSVNVVGNYFDATGGNSALTLAPDLGPTVNNYSPYLVTNNYFNGGNYTIKVANGSGGAYHNWNNIVAENRFGPTHTYGYEQVQEYRFYDFPTNVDNATGAGV